MLFEMVSLLIMSELIISVDLLLKSTPNSAVSSAVPKDAISRMLPNCAISAAIVITYVEMLLYVKSASVKSPSSNRAFARPAVLDFKLFPTISV